MNERTPAAPKPAAKTTHTLRTTLMSYAGGSFGVEIVGHEVGGALGYESFESKDEAAQVAKVAAQAPAMLALLRGIESLGVEMPAAMVDELRAILAAIEGQS